MYIIKIFNFKEMSLVDGEGIRFVIFFAGCPRACNGCHNPASQNINNGVDYDMDDLIEKIRDVKDMHDGITLSGGDPFFQKEKLYEFLIKLRKDEELKKINVWCYTGYNMSDLKEDHYKKRCLRYIDVIVDGEYDENLPPIKFAGSSNQTVYSRVGISNHFLRRNYNGNR